MTKKKSLEHVGTITKAAVGTYDLRDKNSVESRFVSRFARAWRRQMNTPDVYFLTDWDHNLISFTMKGDEIIAYPGMSRPQLFDMLENKGAGNDRRAVRYKVDKSYEHNYLQLLAIMKELNIDF